MIRGLGIIELADGQIQASRDYFDVYGVLIQLGGLPPPGAGAPAATPSA